MMQQYYGCQFTKLVWGKCTSWLTLLCISKELSETFNTAETPKTFCCNIFLLEGSSEKEENMTVPGETLILINIHLHYPRNSVTKCGGQQQSWQDLPHRILR